MEGISTRLRRTNPLAKSGSELIMHYRAFEEDFLEFFPTALARFRPRRARARSR